MPAASSEPDQHGNVHVEMQRRWRLCLAIAERITGRPAPTPEAQMLARALFGSDVPTTA
jgi:hypothetical protein